MTANSGTPITIPMKPKIPPNKRRAKVTQNSEIPVVVPKILGPIMFPSICCNIIIKITNHRHCMGSMSKMKNAQGIAPIKGPKKGIIFVTPTITLIRSV